MRFRFHDDPLPDEKIESLVLASYLVCERKGMSDSETDHFNANTAETCAEWNEKVFC
jgi:hypothetical protein